MKAFALGAAVCILALSGGTAGAHAVLRGASPAPAAVVTTAPTTLKLQFNEAVLPRFTTLEVTGPDGRALHAGPVKVERGNKTRLSAPLRGAGAPGVYTVQWTAATADMHKMTGSYTFTVAP
jgi:methionine-rich copper-binding protein CopC